MDDFFDEFGGVDWGSSSGADVGGFDWSGVDFGGDLGGFDFSDLGGDLGGFDFSGLDLGGFDFSGLDLGGFDFSDLSDISDTGAFLGNLDVGSEAFNWDDFYGGIESARDLGGASFGDMADWYSSTGENYLTGGVKFPGQGFQAPAGSLYQAEGELAPSYLGEGLQLPTIPGMTTMGGAQGLSVEIPTQYDEFGNVVPGSGGYINAMAKEGLIPYNATPVLGDPKSFINDPSVLGRPVFGTDYIKYPDGTTVRMDPITGKITTTKEYVAFPGGAGPSGRGDGGGGGGGDGKPGGDGKDGKGGTDGKDGKGGGTTTPTTPKLTDNNALLMALLGGLLGLLGRKEAPKLPVGYQGGIPKYTATRVPGRGVEYTKMAATGGLMGLAAGGNARPARYLRGGTDGMADKIQTDIDGKQPARLSSGEFVIPADIVGALGSGNSEAGAEVLYDMMDRVRKHAYGHTKQIKQANPKKVLPA